METKGKAEMHKLSNLSKRIVIEEALMRKDVWSGRNYDLSDPNVRYRIWRNEWLFLLLGWAFKNSLCPTSDVVDRRLGVRVHKGLLYTVVVFL